MKEHKQRRIVMTYSIDANVKAAFENFADEYSVNKSRYIEKLIVADLSARGHGIPVVGISATDVLPAETDATDDDMSWLND